MTLARLKIVGVIATSLLFANLIGALAAIVVRSIASPLALKIGAAYGLVSGILVVALLQVIIDHRRLLPAASAVHVPKSMPVMQRSVLFLVVAIFGFVALSLPGAAAYTSAFGAPAVRTLKVIESHRGRFSCYQHSVEGVQWFASGGRFLCFGVPLRPGSTLVLRGRESALGMAVSTVDRGHSG